MGKLISSILIANRGEIALRVIRACKELRIKSIALYSDEDLKSKHVKSADEAYYLGPPAPAKSYLNIEKIIEIAESGWSRSNSSWLRIFVRKRNFSAKCEERVLYLLVHPARPWH